METSYHSKYASQWVVTLGDGTDESNLKMSNAIANLEPFLGELFNNDDFTEMCSQNDFLPEPTSIFDSWKNEVEAILQKGNLDFPDIILKKEVDAKVNTVRHLVIYFQTYNICKELIQTQVGEHGKRH